jgi:hypothetical protein
MATDYSESTIRLHILQALISALDAFDSKRSSLSEDQDAPCTTKKIADWVVDRGRKACETMEFFWAHQRMYSQGGTLQYIHILHQKFGGDDGDELERISSLEAFWEMKLREVTRPIRLSLALN